MHWVKCGLAGKLTSPGVEGDAWAGAGNWGMLKFMPRPAVALGINCYPRKLSISTSNMEILFSVIL